MIFNLNSYRIDTMQNETESCVHALYDNYHSAISTNENDQEDKSNATDGANYTETMKVITLNYISILCALFSSSFCCYCDFFISFGSSFQSYVCLVNICFVLSRSTVCLWCLLLVFNIYILYLRCVSRFGAPIHTILLYRRITNFVCVFVYRSCMLNILYDFLLLFSL